MDENCRQNLIKNNGEAVCVSTKWDIIIHCDSEEEQKHVIELLDKFAEQQISKNDEVVIKLPKYALKYSNNDYVVYKKDWIKKHAREEFTFYGGGEL